METSKSLINIAPLAEVTVSSKSRWSTADEEREILTAEHSRPFSFHTELEDSPWILVDLKRCYCINYIRILNRLDWCKERSKSLRIEYSSDKENYNILLDMNEVWGDVLDVPVENVDIRFLRFSLKEKHYFHLHKIEIFTNLEFFIQNCGDDEEKKVIELCDLINSEFNGRFIITLDDRFNKIVLSEKDNDKNDIKYNITFDEKETIFNIELITNHWKDPDFYFFITTKAQQFNYKMLDPGGGDRIYLVKSITNNSVIEEIKYSDILVNNTVLYTFLKVINNRKLIVNKDEITKIDSNKNNFLIIEPDLMRYCGFADKMIGILSMINICNEMNIDFFIKFTRPFELNRYYKFKDYNLIEPLRLNNGDSYSFAFGNSFSPMMNNLREIILYSLRFYNTINIGMNVLFLKNKYKEIFQKNFVKTELLEEKLSHYIDIINGEYITISVRTLNCFGDFNEADPRFSPLNEGEQASLIKKCKKQIIKFVRTINKKYKIVVLSDSSMFLNYIRDIPNVYVFPENIMHIAGNIQNVDEDIFLKTIIDFNIIMEASHIYRFKTEHLYNTRFPLTASLCSGKPFTHHEF